MVTFVPVLSFLLRLSTCTNSWFVNFVSALILFEVMDMPLDIL